MQEKNIRLIFIISVMLKGISATLEIIGGILFFFTGAITSLVHFLVQGELAEDPADRIANFLQQYIPYLAQHSQLFTAFYLLSHGVVKIFLVVGLLRNKLWAYPLAIVVFLLFIVYQVYRYIHTHSVFLIMLTILDLLVVWLTWHEYKTIKKALV